MNQSGHEKSDFDVWGQKAPPKQQSGGRKRPQNVKVGAKSAPAIRTRQNPDESQYKSGGRKRPQNSKVGAESAPKMSKWGQKVPPQFGHDKIWMKVNIKVGEESAPKIAKLKW